MSDEARRGRSATHYLIRGPLTDKLETVLALVSQALAFPAVQVNIVDEETLHTIAFFGPGSPVATGRSQSVCDTVVRSGEPLIVPDVVADPRFADLTPVVDGEVGAYLGIPLLGREAMVIGAICVVDPGVRTITPDQLRMLTEFGKVVEDELDLIRRLREQRLEGDGATAEIARAIRAGEIGPWYQPIVDLATGAVHGFEALARWEHPSRVIEDPRRFVPIAEDSDLIIELDHAVMKHALGDLGRWHQVDPTLRMSVNISARHLRHPGCVGTLERVAVAAGVDPGSISLELTETSPLDTREAPVVSAVLALRQLGFQVWLDDFGTGWSSLDQLLWLPVDGIKIDRAVTLSLGTPVGDALLVAVTGLATALNLLTTIEGVETRAAADLARRHGCHYGQGHFWSRATPASDVAPRPG